MINVSHQDLNLDQPEGTGGGHWCHLRACPCHSVRPFRCVRDLYTACACTHTSPLGIHAQPFCWLGPRVGSCSSLPVGLLDTATPTYRMYLEFPVFTDWVLTETSRIELFTMTSEKCFSS